MAEYCAVCVYMCVHLMLIHTLGYFQDQSQCVCHTGQANVPGRQQLDNINMFPSSAAGISVKRSKECASYWFSQWWIEEAAHNNSFFLYILEQIHPFQWELHNRKYGKRANATHSVTLHKKTRELHDDQIADRDEHDCWIWMPVLIQPRRDTVMELLSQPNHQNTRKTNYRSVETHV